MTPRFKTTQASTLTALLIPFALAAQPTVLRDGTPVRLRLSQNLASSEVKVGQSVDFEVLEDVKLGNTVVIARGATALATVTTAQPKRTMARGGKIDLNIDYVRLANNDKVAVRASKEAKGGGHTGAMTGAMVATSIVFWPAAPFFLFMHGKDANIPKGTEITAYVEGDVTLDLSTFAASQLSEMVQPEANLPPPASAAKPSAGGPVKAMTNRDVISLKSAGFTDEFVISKIKNSPGDYTLDTDEIIGLKSAAVSEPVIQAMMAAGSSTATAAVTPIAPVRAPVQPRQTPTAVADATTSRVLKPHASSAGNPPAPTPVPPQFALIPVTVLSNPAGAGIWVNGYPAGLTPAVVKLQPGSYKLTLKARGFRDYSQQITVESGEVRSFGIALETAN